MMPMRAEASHDMIHHPQLPQLLFHRLKSAQYARSGRGREMQEDDSDRAGSMAGVENEPLDRAIELWSLKDVLVAIPFVASTLALTWEVGYFLKIGGGSFGLFSLTEHITFAIQALPFALGLTTFAVVMWFVKMKMGPSLSIKKRGITLFVIGALTGAFMTVHYAVAPDRVDVGEAILIIMTAIPFSLVIVVSRQQLTSWIAICLGSSAAFVLAYAFGVQSARSQIFSTRSLNIIKISEKGKDAEREIKARIMRTGERGVLYFDPATQSFSLMPWESVKRIDWAINPLFRK
jgi:hypothetical protein